MLDLRTSNTVCTSSYVTTFFLRTSCVVVIVGYVQPQTSWISGCFYDLLGQHAEMLSCIAKCGHGDKIRLQHEKHNNERDQQPNHNRRARAPARRFVHISKMLLSVFSACRKRQREKICFFFVSFHSSSLCCWINFPVSRVRSASVDDSYVQVLLISVKFLSILYVLAGKCRY